MYDCCINLEETNSKNYPFFDLREGMFVAEKELHGYFLQEEQSQLVHELLTTNLQEIHHIKMPRATRKELLRQFESVGLSNAGASVHAPDEWSRRLGSVISLYAGALHDFGHDFQLLCVV